MNCVFVQGIGKIRGSERKSQVSEAEKRDRERERESERERDQ